MISLSNSCTRTLTDAVVGCEVLPEYTAAAAPNAGAVCTSERWSAAAFNAVHLFDDSYQTPVPSTETLCLTSLNIVDC